jgi:putative thioredoxin
MNDSPYIHNVTLDTFQSQVIEASHTVPVLVDFWADWCGPCHMQVPVLAKLVGEYAGKFLLAKVNTDTERHLAQEHGIRSLPTMRLYRNGEVVEEILGAQTESTLRALLDPYIERDSDKLRLAALEAHRQGRTEEAISMLRKAQEADPENSRVQFALVGLYLDAGRLAEAESLLEALPWAVREETEARKLSALLDPYIERDSDKLRLAALDAHQQGRTEKAISMLRKAQEADPENSRVQFALVGLYLDAGRLAEAESLLEALPWAVREEPEAHKLSALLDFSRIAQDAAPIAELERQLGDHPGDSQARYRLAARYVLDGRLQEAMEELLYIIRNDRAFGDDAARKGLLAVFGLLDDEDELVKTYRRKLSAAML